MSLGLGSSLSKTGLATPGIVTDSLVLKHNYAAGGVVPVSDGSASFNGSSDYVSLWAIHNQGQSATYLDVTYNEFWATYMGEI